MPSIFSSGAHAFADDAFDAFQQLLAQPAGARGLAQQIFRLVELTGACRVDLVTFGRRERADLLRFGRRFGGDLLRFGKASCGAHLRFGLGGDPQRLALGLALRGDHVGELAPLGDFALAGGDRLLLGLDDLGRTASAAAIAAERSDAFLASSTALLISAISTSLSRSVAKRAHVAILGDARLLDAALGGDARALHLLGGGDFGLLEGLPLGDLQAFQMPLALEPDLIERAILGDPLGLGVLVLDDLGAALFRLRLDHRERLFGERDLPVELQNLERLLAGDFVFALLALAGDARGFQLQFEIDLLALGLLAHLQLGFVERAAAGDFAPLRLLLAADALLGDGELLRQPRRLDRLARGKLGLLGLLFAQRALLASARRAARRGGTRPRAPARAAHIRSRDRSRRPSSALPGSGCGYRPACAARSRCASCAAFRSIP